MAKYLLALFALQAVGLLAGFGDSVSQVAGVIGNRSVASGLVLAQVLVSCWVAYEDWREEREARERFRR